MNTTYAAYLEAVGNVAPMILSTIPATGPHDKIFPITGKFFIIDNIIGKKFPNKFNIPKISKIIPIMAYLQRTNIIPRKKQIVPRTLAFRPKNTTV